MNARDQFFYRSPGAWWDNQGHLAIPSTIRNMGHLSQPRGRIGGASICVQRLMSRGFTRESARRACGEIQAVQGGFEDRQRVMDNRGKPRGRIGGASICVQRLMSRGFTRESARRACGEIQAVQGGFEDRQRVMDNRGKPRGRIGGASICVQRLMSRGFTRESARRACGEI